MSFSPYSEKARWALDHHGVSYTWCEHVPFVGELALRLRARQWRGRVTVPMAVEGDVVLRDSLAIAQHAERVGRGEPLFHDEPEVMPWVERSSVALDASRITMLARLLGDREAMRESMPGWIPRPLRGIALPLAAFTITFLQGKYATGTVPHDQAKATVRECLSALRAALFRDTRSTPRPTILESFSFADIAMATALQMVSPVSDEYIRLGRAERRAWTDAELAREYADVLAWRDRLYATYRRR
jgi:glutathione S-transferase